MVEWGSMMLRLAYQYRPPRYGFGSVPRLGSRGIACQNRLNLLPSSSLSLTPRFFSWMNLNSR